MTKKEQILNWSVTNKIPGKIQAIFSAENETAGGDFRYILREVKGKQVLVWEGIFPNFPVPDSLLKIEEQLQKDHLRQFKKQILQIIFRTCGDTATDTPRFGALIQCSLSTSEQTRAYKTFLEFLQRSHPEILCCHSVSTRPYFPFDTSNPPAAMQYTLHKGFGAEFLPLANSGFYFHILDYLPKSKGTYLQLPDKLHEWLHPAKGDRLLACHCGAALEALSLTKNFADVNCLDVREWAKLSFEKNTSANKIVNAKFFRDKLDADWVKKFFAGEKNKGKWTIFLNPPQGELLSQPLTQSIAATAPERIVHIIGDLENAAREVKRWRSAGYILRKILPVEWHPELKHLDLAMLFVPDRDGLLGRKPNAKPNANSQQTKLQQGKSRQTTKAKPKEKKNYAPRFVQR
ncbi:hypothetical protein AGMMS49938_14830 [Fibrobacterales bacterium]|nr:hypothetical protein AGMMS49938_14830 [Fibrobacterales bacterium]